MSKELVEILNELVLKLGGDCLNKSGTHRYVDDYAPKSDAGARRKVKAALKSGIFADFYSAADIAPSASKLSEELFWKEDVASDVALSFAEALGIDVSGFRATAGPASSARQPQAASRGNVNANARQSAPAKMPPDFVCVETPIRLGEKAFYMCDHPVTQDEYFRIMGTNPSRFSGKDNPVETVSWYDCIEYCNLCSRSEGLEECYSGSGDDVKCDFSKNGYRLPTEAEWEWAARGGFKSGGHAYSGSDNIGDVAWYEGNSGQTTHPVKRKRKQPNELGLYDMSGNVLEWCWDWYDGAGVKPPCGPASGSDRVCRGGSWYNDADNCSVSNRDYYDPSFTYYDLGFRLARSAKD